MPHNDEHPTLMQWDRFICLEPGCGVVIPRDWPAPEPEFLAYGEPTEKTEAVAPNNAPTVEVVKKSRRKA